MVTWTPPGGRLMSHDQRDTPYLDAVLRYRATGYTPFHTPGHKLGRGAPEGLRELLGDPCLQVDIAMAGGVEDTRESTHLIRLAEDYAAEAWGSDRCWFLVNGSTSGIHSLVLTLCGPGDEVIIPRNAHKSMLAGLIFSGAVPVYLEPDVDPLWGIPLTVSAEVAHRALAERPAAKAIFVTSPTYNGHGGEVGAEAVVGGRGHEDRLGRRVFGEGPVRDFGAHRERDAPERVDIRLQVNRHRAREDEAGEHRLVGDARDDHPVPGAAQREHQRVDPARGAIDQEPAAV